MKSKDYLDAIAEKRDKTKLKTKLEIYGPDEMSNDELKKLANWGMYRYDQKLKRNNDGGYVVAAPVPVVEDIVAGDMGSLSSRFAQRAQRPPSANMRGGGSPTRTAESPTHRTGTKSYLS